MLDRQMPWTQKLLHRFSHRLTQRTKFPKGDLVATCRNLGSRGFYPERVVDIGANRARWSDAVKRVFPAAEFTLVEPQVEMEADLKRFCEKHPGSRYIIAGAGAENGELPLALVGGTSTTFAMDAEKAQRLGIERRNVPVRTLDSLCEELVGGVPDMVKIDAEGFEFEIMKGATKMLGEIELFLLELPFFKTYPGGLNFSESIAAMADYGYEVYDFTWFHRRPHDNATGQCEAVFARREGFLRRHMGWE